jgi:hypothetical protein
MKTKIKYSLDERLFELRKHTGKRYKYSDLSKFSGIDRKIIENLAHNKTYQDLLPILASLLDFFTVEGMPITIDQLFTVQEEGSQAENLDG